MSDDLYPGDDVFPSDATFPGQPLTTTPSTETASVPDAAYMRRRFRNIAWSELGYPPESPDGLTDVVAESVVEFEGLTGLDPALLATDKRAPLVKRAIGMLVGYNAAGESMEVLESAADFDLLSSFSISRGHSETRRPAGFARNQIHPWPALSKLLGLIIYFDSRGVQAFEQPALEDAALRPYPGQDALQEFDYRWMNPFRAGPFAPPDTGLPVIWIEGP